MFPYTLYYVEDDLEVQRVFAEIFSKYIQNVVCFTDGYKALEAIKTSSFDIFVTAVSIPNVNGLQLAREVKKLYMSIPVVLF